VVGVQGPAGPAGVQGVTGPVGPVGPVGPAGPSTNIVYSNWIPSRPSPGATFWTATGAAAYNAVGIFNVTAPGITANIMNQGVVLAYARALFSLTNATAVFQLPTSSDVNTGGSWNDYYDFIIPSAGNITFIYKSSLPWTLTSVGSAEFRYMLIQGQISGGRFINGPASGYTIQDLKKMPYAQVTQLFNIPVNGGNDK
jgi:hypothetical protein